MTEPVATADFQESVKSQARRLAAFRCCYCRELMGDHVHHIIPKEKGGTNDLDNTMLLCVQCHTNYGHRPDKRKQLREARDVWYEIVERRYGGAAIDGLEKITERLTTKEDLSATAARIHERLDEVVTEVRAGRTNPATLTNIESTVVTSAAAYLTAAMSYPRRCPACGFGWESALMSEDKCPKCGALGHVAPPSDILRLH